MGAEAFSAFCYVPSDIISQRLQVESPTNFRNTQFHYTSTTEVAKSIWKNEGLKGFFRGYGPYLMVFGMFYLVFDEG